MVPADPSLDRFAAPGAVAEALDGIDYLADEGLATAAFLALRMGKPLLLEGQPGVGKTEAAKAIAAIGGRDLIRLQCHEGIDATQALYEWNYPRQLLAIRQADGGEVDLYGQAFLIERPLLAAVRRPRSTVLLIDEVDRSDHEFEAFLLEFLSDFQISIPETGAVRAEVRPIVVLTSNRTRELHDALRRRCVYHWIAYPDPAREAEIILRRAGGIVRATAEAVARAVQDLRRLPLVKPPGIAEAVEWTQAARIIRGAEGDWPDAFRRAVGVVVKDEDDMAVVTPEIGRVLEEAFA
ncbi:MAG: MoxR family ATPase [Sphingobium sp.]|mgnify:CR=1 FL=1|uniref:AAA family ATPase n=1 Tax=Sphingobium sp. TaxID=1912891 RepID=UPI002E1F9933